MSNILVAILTNRLPERLDRCILSVKSQTTDIVVVCNTLDESFIPEAQAITEKHGITFVVTESNGTPARGKNTVLDYFATTEYDHLFIVDGDDFLCENALAIIQKTVAQRPCDVLALVQGEHAVVGDEYMLANDWAKTDDFKAKLYVSRDWRLAIPNIRPLARLKQEIDKIFPNNRFLLFSKKSLPYVKFDETLPGLTEYHLSVKLLHYANNKEIVYQGLSSPNVYVYDTNNLGNYKSFMRKIKGEEFVNYFLDSLSGYNLENNVDVISID